MKNVRDRIKKSVGQALSEMKPRQPKSYVLLKEKQHITKDEYNQILLEMENDGEIESTREGMYIHYTITEIGREKYAMWKK